MPIKLESLTDYQESLYDTLPHGTTWPPINEDSNIRTFVDSVGYDTRLVALDAVEMLESSFPSSSAYIEDWERVLGLHTVVSGVFFRVDENKVDDKINNIISLSKLPTDISTRVGQVLTYFQSDGYNNEAFYQTLAILFNLTITIEQTVVFEFTINILTGSLEDIDYFTLLANYYKPVYTKLIIN